MPVEVKPLFRPDVLRPRVKTFELPESATSHRPLIQKWAELLDPKDADRFKEQELLPEFLSDVFTSVLGYDRPSDNPARYTISRERYVEVDGKFADAAIGEFTPEQSKFVIALEGKGPTDPLDRPFKSRKMSAVDQGYRYAINLPCDWIIVTSMREIRLYCKGNDQHTYERFLISDLAANDFTFKRFVFLLGADRVVPTRGNCHLDQLRAASEKAGRELTKDFYLRYANMREDVFEQICAHNPEHTRHVLLSSTQKLLDRVLFCAFCEDRGLLPEHILAQAFEHHDPFTPKPIWDTFRGLFRSIDTGNEALKIPPYNGGLFAYDEVLDRLAIPDAICRHFKDIGEYDYRSVQTAVEDADESAEGSLIDVDILGHIFEQSITDLEQLRNELDGLVPPQGKEKHKTRRKKEGAFYTPAFITRYIIEQTLGAVLADRFEALRAAHQDDATGTAVKALDDPRVYDVESMNNPQREALTRFWEAWQDELATVRVLDPACGSGAFLIEAFDQLHTAYQASNDRLEEIRGHRTLFDLDRQILQNNLYGVDLNEEAIQICRLSLWIKTAQRGKVLTSLDHSIRVGNSVVDDPAVHPLAFDWNAAFPEVTAAGGFDVVVGNPPYVRQQLLKEIKPYLKNVYRAFHGVADLYVYFYELGIRLLAPKGRLSFVVTNKWMKANYGEPLRRFFREYAWIESVVDFGHAKQIFQDADVFPSIIVARRPTSGTTAPPTRVCAIPREQLRIDDLRTQIHDQGFEVDPERLGSESWQLEPAPILALYAKIRAARKSLAKYVGTKPNCGILTGFNEAFLIDSGTRTALVSADPRSAEIIRPYIRGQDVDRWHSNWAGLWMIALKSSGDHPWPWRDAGNDAEAVFQSEYPSIHKRLKHYEQQLRIRSDQGRNWWELRSCAYWEVFESPKIVYQEIQFHPAYAFDTSGQYGNNKTLFFPTDDLYLLAVLNSPLMWWHNWRYLPHMKDEALCPAGFLMEDLPIATPTDDVRNVVETAVQRVIEITVSCRQASRSVVDWLRVEHNLDKLGNALSDPMSLDEATFVAEVKKRRGRKHPLSVAALKSLRDEHARTIIPAQSLFAEVASLEHRVSDAVNAAYGLTPEEIDLMWKTAPPRMPISRPKPQ